jgi:hypothetical protein
VGAGLVAAAEEERLGRGDAEQCLGGVLQTADAGGVVRGTYDYEIVMHDQATVNAVPGRHEILLSLGGVGKDHVGLAFLTEPEGGAGANGDGLDVVGSVPFKQRHQFL